VCLRSSCLLSCVLLLGASLLKADIAGSANQLIREGRYEAAKQFLKQAKSTAAGAEAQTVETMLGGLESYLLSRKQPASRRIAPAEPPEAPAFPFPPINNGGSPVAPPPVPSPPASKYQRSSRPAHIIALGGYSDSWSAASSFNSPYEVQGLFMTAKWPTDSIERFKDAGYIITATAGDSSRWAVVMSRHKDRRRPLQYVYGPASLDQQFETWIADGWKKGYHITSVAGFGNEWVVTITADMGWGRQRFHMPAPYKADWVQARLNEGYSVTSAAGDRHVSGNGVLTDTYFLVATQGTGRIYGEVGARLTRAEFRPWLEEKRKTMAPVAFLGFKDTPGAIFASEKLQDSGWGFVLNASNQDFVEWSKSIRMEESVR